MNLIEDIRDELKQFLSGKTIDALISPIIYLMMNNFLSLKRTIIISLSVAVLIGIYRLIKKENILYAVGGIGGVILASTMALISGNATNYFLPKILTSAGLFLILLVSIFLGKPAAAVLSHLTRGWAWDWFMRKDIKPAYREVTIVWTILAFIRTFLQVVLYQRGNLVELGWASILLRFPATITVLILTLVYGVWRLKKLGGPGVEEFAQGKEAPWEGQKKGF